MIVTGQSTILSTIGARMAGGRKYRARGYSADSLDECIINAVRAEKERTIGIIGAPMLSRLSSSSRRNCAVIIAMKLFSRVSSVFYDLSNGG